MSYYAKDILMDAAGNKIVVRDIRSFDRNVSRPDRYEVIGNIHDNPELIGKE